MAMLEFRTPGFKGFSTKYSPFFDSRIAAATGQYYGLVGNGRLYILGLGASGIFAEKWFDTQDAIYDVAWSEQHENQILAAGGDGTVKLFDVTVPEYPVAQWHEHGREVYAVHWSLVGKDVFLSSSWDGSVKIFNPARDTSIAALPTHSCTYSAQFSPHEHGLVSAASSDSMLRLFDLRVRASANNHLVMALPVHAPPKTLPGVAPHKAPPPTENLTHDWNKYRSTVLAVGGVDRLIRTFDIRNPNGGPVAVLPGHDYAVRRVSWSPHLSDVLLSASYDMTCRVWTDGTAVGVAAQNQGDPMAYGGGRELGRMNAHSEFAMGVDWCLFGAEGWCASTAWDERVLVWDVRNIMGP